MYRDQSRCTKPRRRCLGEGQGEKNQRGGFRGILSVKGSIRLPGKGDYYETGQRQAEPYSEGGCCAV